MTLLSLENVRRSYRAPGRLLGRHREILAVDGVTLAVARGQTLGIVGESGCGKSTTARLAVGLDMPDQGEIRFEGAPMPRTNTPAWRQARQRMQMVFQDPLGALDRRLTVAAQIEEPLRIHAMGTPDERRERVAVLLRAVSLGPSQGRLYPHELSGGQRQRVVLARALATRPKLLVCDEPVSALDVSIQAQVLNLLTDLQAELGLGMLFISHDLRVVRHVSHEIAVMYLGRIVERGPADRVIADPVHPYTRALIAAMPVLSGARGNRLALHGESPNPANRLSGCVFHPRCPIAKQICRREAPALLPFDSTHQVACHLAAT